MIVNHSIEKVLLFDGREDEAFTASFELNAGIDALNLVQLADFMDNRLENLKAVIDSADYDTILKSGHFSIDNGFLHLHKGSDGLRLFFYKKHNTILVFASGETQPMRHKVYLEGIWIVE